MSWKAYPHFLLPLYLHMIFIIIFINGWSVHMDVILYITIKVKLSRYSWITKKHSTRMALYLFNCTGELSLWTIMLLTSLMDKIWRLALKIFLLRNVKAQAITASEPSSHLLPVDFSNVGTLKTTTRARIGCTIMFSHKLIVASAINCHFSSRIFAHLYRRVPPKIVPITIVHRGIPIRLLVDVIFRMRRLVWLF